MKSASVSEIRQFNLQQPVNATLVDGERVCVHAWHFEAGQELAPDPAEAAYHVLEGELRFTQGAETLRLAKGNVLVGAPERIDNPSGGLAVVLVTTSK
ncbi:MAG TPA: hypothetical protein VHN99_05350 [Deinococcales bacterium]|nr:hypothetical protein [Deinococcales bacterium]